MLRASLKTAQVYGWKALAPQHTCSAGTGHSYGLDWRQRLQKAEPLSLFSAFTQMASVSRSEETLVSRNSLLGCACHHPLLFSFRKWKYPGLSIFETPLAIWTHATEGGVEGREMVKPPRGEAQHRPPQLSALLRREKLFKTGEELFIFLTCVCVPHAHGYTCGGQRLTLGAAFLTASCPILLRGGLSRNLEVTK